MRINVTQEKIVPDLVDSIAENIKILCDNKLEKLAIYNILLARWSSVLATKNFMTNSCRHIKPFPLAYYGLNLLPSGGNKNKPLTAVEGIFKWIEQEYEEANERAKQKYIEIASDGIDDEKEIEKIKKRAEQLPKLKSKVNSATSQKLYSICETIAKSGYGSLFIYDTEFVKKFEAKISGKSLDDTIDSIYNLYDGEPDFLDTVMVNRESISGISCNVCYASDYSRLLKNVKTSKEFRSYLQDGFARRIYLYSAKNANSFQYQDDFPSVEEIDTAKGKMTGFYHQTKRIYQDVRSEQIYEFSKEANFYIQNYVQNVNKTLKKIYSYTEILSDDDEIMRIDLDNSAWKIVKTAFLFHLIQYPSILEVSVDSVKMAIRYFEAFHDNLSVFLNKKPMDKLDEYKNIVYKNLDREIKKNTDLRKEFGITTNHWVEFCKTVLPLLLDELQSEHIYYYERKEGKTEFLTFYRKEM